MTFYRPDVVKVVTTAANQKLVITVAGASLSTPTVYKGTYTASSGTIDSNWCNTLTSSTSTSTNTAAVLGTDYTVDTTGNVTFPTAGTYHVSLSLSGASATTTLKGKIQ